MTKDDTAHLCWHEAVQHQHEQGKDGLVKPNRGRAEGTKTEIDLSGAEWQIMGPAKEWKDAENASSFINKRRTSSVRQHKEATFCLSVRCLCWKERKFLRLHKVPPANAAVKCKMHGRVRGAGRGEATQMLMQALRCRYRLMQPLSPVAPAHLPKAKKDFLSLSKENFFHPDEAIMHRTSSRQMKMSKSDTDFTWLQHLEDFSPLFPIIIKSLSRAYINWHEGHLP